MTMAMVTARVNAERKRDAEKVLKRNGAHLFGPDS